MYLSSSIGPQKPLHVITVNFNPFSQSVYYNGHVCHFLMRSELYTECNIRVFRSDMSEVLSGMRSHYLKFPNLRDDMGLVQYADPKTC